jgi:hypothetical protein
VHGNGRARCPRAFIGELPEAHVDNVASEGFYGNYGGGGFANNSERASRHLLQSGLEARKGGAQLGPRRLRMRANRCAARSGR